MRFTWDSDKNLANIRRHGIAFSEAARIFDGLTVERVDDRFDYGEVRVYAIGLLNGNEITVIYTDRNEDEDASSPHAKRSRMKSATSGKTSKAEPRTDWKRLREMAEEEVHAAALADPDAQPTDDEFWKDARVVVPNQPKTTVTMHLDTDVLDWLRRRPGYQMRVNSILRAYMDAHINDC